MTPDEMRDEAKQSRRLMKHSLDHDQLVVAAVQQLEDAIWTVGAEICERLDRDSPHDWVPDVTALAQLLSDEHTDAKTRADARDKLERIAAGEDPREVLLG